MIRILANDGIHPDGRLLLEEAEYEVSEDTIAQADLPSRIHEYDVLLVRSATKVTKEVIDAAKKLKIIGRGGVGMDNIDLEYAKKKGILVINTPAASSRAVAELAISHVFSLSRRLHKANRQMPTGDFKKLKKEYESGTQVFGKTIGIIGFGRIGQEVARMATGLGMKVLAHDPFVNDAEISVLFSDHRDLRLSVKIETVSMDHVIRNSDIITVHIPFSGGKAVLGAEEIAKMRTGVLLINTARGGTIDEEALIEGLNSGKIGGAGLDVFENEPTPRPAIINHPNISLTPHIGASTQEAQGYIGTELADKILRFYGEIK
jgi:D-3-phosphoglycerate dehydrogenase / 2-oxoglutarate reductase